MLPTASAVPLSRPELKTRARRGIETYIWMTPLLLLENRWEKTETKVSPSSGQKVFGSGDANVALGGFNTKKDTEKEEEHECLIYVLWPVPLYFALKNGDRAKFEKTFLKSGQSLLLPILENELFSLKPYTDIAQRFWPEIRLKSNTALPPPSASTRL